MRTADGLIVGTAIGRMTLDDIDEIIPADSGFAGRGEIGVLWDSDGIRLSQPAAPELRFRPFEPLSREVAAQLIAEKRFGPRTPELLNVAAPAPGLVERSGWLLYDPAAIPTSRSTSTAGVPTPRSCRSPTTAGSTACSARRARCSRRCATRPGATWRSPA